ncbi:gp240 [Bacillus phage W.Ph.]|uniref:Gp240 n=1 Tax=Bacillus phage W.Ph. TaxID=764595 RepID=G9B1Z1_9CAUD|nr:gp240 [Bacillus phage W.Ph.]ADH03386.1 gp240 [Bacillus phage W.Ph.]
MKEIFGKLLYRIFDAIGTLSVFFIVTDGLKWKYVILLFVSAILSTMLPYEVGRKEVK